VRLVAAVRPQLLGALARRTRKPSSSRRSRRLVAQRRRLGGAVDRGALEPADALPRSRSRRPRRWSCARTALCSAPPGRTAPCTRWPGSRVLQRRPATVTPSMRPSWGVRRRRRDASAGERRRVLVALAGAFVDGGLELRRARGRAGPALRQPLGLGSPAGQVLLGGEGWPGRLMAVLAQTPRALPPRVELGAQAARRAAWSSPRS